MTTQRWNPDGYATHAGFVAEYGVELLGLLAPRAGERVLDLGCGDGVLTARLLEAGCSVVGIDASADQVAAARSRGIDARVAFAERLPFDDEFDAVFSNAALHWVKDAGAAVQSVRRALRTGGRFIGECGGAGNITVIRAAIWTVLARHGFDAATLDPWYFPSDAAYKALLEEHGFAVRFIALFARPTPLPTDMAGWLTTFAGPFLGAVDPGHRASLLAEIIEELRPKLYNPQNGWTADYVRLRFAADNAG